MGSAEEARRLGCSLPPGIAVSWSVEQQPSAWPGGYDTVSAGNSGVTSGMRPRRGRALPRGRRTQNEVGTQVARCHDPVTKFTERLWPRARAWAGSRRAVYCHDYYTSSKSRSPKASGAPRLGSPGVLHHSEAPPFQPRWGVVYVLPSSREHSRGSYSENVKNCESVPCITEKG